MDGFWYNLLHFGIEGLLVLIGIVLVWFVIVDEKLDREVRKNERRNRKYL